MSLIKKVFNPPPGWPKPPPNWTPPAGWSPEPDWPNPPEGWVLWLTDENDQDGAADVAGIPLPVQTDDVDALKDEITDLRRQLADGHSGEENIPLSDDNVLQSIGIYRYHHPLENAAGFKEQLTDVEVEIVSLVKDAKAIEVSNQFTFENSLAKGQRLCSDLGKLMLRAYNSEADNCIRSLRVGNIQTARKRMEASRKAIARLGAVMEMQISEAYHQLRLQEIELTSDWLMKKHEEKDKLKEDRARLREEKRVEKEFSDERERLNKEKSHLQNAIDVLSQKGETDPQLEEKLSIINDAIEQNDYRLANIRSGYVYVISNRGAFGNGVVKIGLTRRLEPQERITELGGASVPFRFDVHALFFSEDAVTLENELHTHFRSRAVNAVNIRKEFFFAKPTEVRAVLIEKMGNLLEFSEGAESLEYLQSSKYWPQDARS
jgi:hypothetical protein